jgi:uncharacterized coiled-coil protein SlyX
MTDELLLKIKKMDMKIHFQEIEIEELKQQIADGKYQEQANVINGQKQYIFKLIDDIEKLKNFANCKHNDNCSGYDKRENGCICEKWGMKE